MKVIQISPCISGAYRLVGETDINQIITEILNHNQEKYMERYISYMGEILYLEGFCNVLIVRKPVMFSQGSDT